jgi:hypothetical protein
MVRDKSHHRPSPNGTATRDRPGEWRGGVSSTMAKRASRLSLLAAIQVWTYFATQELRNPFA